MNDGEGGNWVMTMGLPLPRVLDPGAPLRAVVMAEELQETGDWRPARTRAAGADWTVLSDESTGRDSDSAEADGAGWKIGSASVSTACCRHLNRPRYYIIIYFNPYTSMACINQLAS